MSESLIDELARKIWDYHHLNHTLGKTDIILALGSNDLRVAEYAAELYLQGWAPLLLFSGNAGALTRERFNRPEAELFAEIALRKGVPEGAMLIEAESTNTGENVVFGLPVVEAALGLATIKSVICLGKICTARRYPMTLQRHWPEVAKMLVTVNPYGAPVERWPTDPVFRERVLAEWHKIALYKAQGFIADWP
jgi:uncharacterized SAM-binding protein YcdF (DUF218 family)